MHLIINSYRGVLSSEDLNNEISEFVGGKIRETVDDPETARKLMPNYFIGTKRMILDNGYFETYNRPNVSLVDLREDPIETFTQGSIQTRDGEHPIDMLVLATGFDAVSGSMLAINPKGRDGLSLKEKWAERFETYLGGNIAGFPNLFMVHGPGAPGVFFTMPLGGSARSTGLAAASAICAAKVWVLLRRLPRRRRFGTMRFRASRSAPSTRAPTPGIWAPTSPGSRQFLGHLMGSQYFKRLTEVAETGFEGFVTEAVRHR